MILEISLANPAEQGIAISRSLLSINRLILALYTHCRLSLAVLTGLGRHWNSTGTGLVFEDQTPPHFSWGSLLYYNTYPPRATGGALVSVQSTSDGGREGFAETCSCGAVRSLSQLAILYSTERYQERGGSLAICRLLDVEELGKFGDGVRALRFRFRPVVLAPIESCRVSDSASLESLSNVAPVRLPAVETLFISAVLSCDGASPFRYTKGGCRVPTSLDQLRAIPPYTTDDGGAEHSIRRAENRAVESHVGETDKDQGYGHEDLTKRIAPTMGGRSGRSLGGGVLMIHSSMYAFVLRRRRRSRISV